MHDQQWTLFDITGCQAAPDQSTQSRNDYTLKRESRRKQNDKDAFAAENQYARVRFSGAAKVMHHMADSLSNCATMAEAGTYLGIIRKTSKKIEDVIVRKQITPDRLTAISRAARGWLAFFSHEANIERYLNTARLARTAFEEHLKNRRRWPKPIHASLRPIRSLYRLQAEQHYTTLVLPVAMICFDYVDFNALAGYAGGESAGRKHVHLKMMSEPFQRIQAELEILGGKANKENGHFHDLADSFNRVNRCYFNNAMIQPHLAWSGRLSRRQFGSYSLVDDRIVVSSVLDHPEVPQYVVDFIMYHEMLHKHHGIQWNNNRMHVHTPAFKRDERRFDLFKQAETFINRLARINPCTDRIHPNRPSPRRPA